LEFTLQSLYLVPHVNAYKLVEMNNEHLFSKLVDVVIFMFKSANLQIQYGTSCGLFEMLQLHLKEWFTKNLYFFIYHLFALISVELNRRYFEEC